MHVKDLHSLQNSSEAVVAKYRRLLAAADASQSGSRAEEGMAA
jgi:hypothetical protein